MTYPRWSIRLLVGAAWILAAFAAVLHLIHRERLDEGAALQVGGSLASLALVLVPLVLLARDDVVGRLRRFVDDHPRLALALAAALVSAYLPYWVLAANSRPGGLLVVLAALGAATFAAVGTRRRGPADGGDLLVVLVIWLPIELRLLDAAYPWPEGGAGRILAVLLSLDCLLYLMLVVRRYDGAGYSLSLRWRDLGLAVAAFAAFAAVGVPIGLAIGFLAPGGWPPGALDLLLGGVGILLVTGIPEEVLFRGFLQGFMERWTGRPWMALAAASLLFGAVHLNNGPAPDWRYALLATLAGVAYGFVFWKTRRVAAAAITHTLVDLTWTRFFMG
jgi:membrane protease YdiL (CAAX protease family)